MSKRLSRHAYKDVSVQQLRSFCATARLGSLGAAADELGLAQPTVWEQVHALERAFGAPLIAPHCHGCHLTRAGEVLTRLAAPLLESMDALKRSFQEALAQVERSLVVAATPRILVDDLPQVVLAFQRRFPHVRLSLLEWFTGEVADAVASGQADLGLTVTGTPPLTPAVSGGGVRGGTTRAWSLNRLMNSIYC